MLDTNVSAISAIEDCKPHEECGVFGIATIDGDIPPAAACYNGLLALQHRGQESCGIAVNDDGVLAYSKDMGLVTDVFNHEKLDKLVGQMGVGHVRYSSGSDSVRENAQPLIMRYVKGAIAIVYNGVLTNGYELRHELEEQGSIFQTTTDPEIISYLIAKERVSAPSIEEALRRVMNKLQGSYAMILLSPQKLIAARDPYGLKPLCMGKAGNDVVFASESCALDAVGATLERDVEPGEIVVVKNGQVKSQFCDIKAKKAVCIFEYIYFARDDSIIDGTSVYEARKRAGRLLAQQHPVEADMVIGVPESGNDSAIGYSEESGIPYERGIVKNGYVGRTFIRPTQAERERGVKIKLNPLKRALEGKRVVMCDDSIVRGTTSARLVKMLKEAGAKEVHMRISSPPFIHACYYGSDIGSSDELIAAKMSIEEIRQQIGADSLGFLDINSLKDIIKPGVDCGFCDACFSGNYPSEISEHVKNGDKDIYCQPLHRV